MIDSRQTPASHPEDPESAADRDARIDDLLLGGLDHYFAGRFQDAINVWGRVLFLDRAHARARAYIERARGAMAERQRKSEELVQEGVAALKRGDDGIARELLTSAVDQGDTPDMAQAYLDRLERLSSERAEQVRDASAARAAAARRAKAARSMLKASSRPVRALPIIGMALVAAAIILFATSKDPLKPFVDLRLSPPASPIAAVRPPDPLPAPRAAELALSRARAMYGAGQLRPALAALDGVSNADPLFAEADRLRSDIQRSLLGLPAAVQSGSAPGVAAATPVAPVERRQ